MASKSKRETLQDFLDPYLAGPFFQNHFLTKSKHFYDLLAVFKADIHLRFLVFDIEARCKKKQLVALRYFWGEMKIEPGIEWN